MMFVISFIISLQPTHSKAVVVKAYCIGVLFFTIWQQITAFVLEFIWLTFNVVLLPLGTDVLLWWTVYLPWVEHLEGRQHYLGVILLVAYHHLSEVKWASYYQSIV